MNHKQYKKLQLATIKIQLTFSHDDDDDVVDVYDNDDDADN